jgi:hypothetical protein
MAEIWFWSQASYRYTILWVTFFDPSDSYFLFADLVGFYTLCIYKCILNMYKNQQNRQTGSRNLMGPKTLPTIWYTYMTLVTKIRFLPSTVTEKNTMKNILDGRKDPRPSCLYHYDIYMIICKYIVIYLLTVSQTNKTFLCLLLFLPSIIQHVIWKLISVQWMRISASDFCHQ